MKRFLILSLAFATILQVASCKKWKYDNSTAPTTNAIVENAFSEMANMSDQAVKGDLVIYGINKPIVRVGDYQ